jgi:tetratricopeptide (TPR) repeat protein
MWRPAARPERICLVAAALALGWVLQIGHGVVQAADRNLEFLAALREAGWNDTAAAYVEWVQDSPLMTEEFRQQLPMERATSLAAQARAVRTRDEQLKLLTQAAENFAQMAATDSQSPAALDALRQAANMYAELALKTLDDAASRSGPALDEVRKASLEHFDHAMTLAADLLTRVTARLASMPKPVVAMADPELKVERQELSDRKVETEFLIALLTFRRSEAFDENSPERNATLDDASEKFGELISTYEVKSVVGATSRFYQGRCAQEQGDYAQAQDCYEDLLREPPGDRPELRALAARAARYDAECLIELDKLDEAIRVGKKCLADMKPEERERAEWLEVAFQLASAYKKQLAEPGQRAAVTKRLETEMHELLRNVAAHPNDYQFDARLALASSLNADASGKDYKTFADALAGGKAALELMNSSLLAINVARENNPDGVAGLQRDSEASKQEARRAFEAAISLADGQTPIAEVNVARYYLSWLMWEAGRIEEAAVLGEFIATRYPEDEFGAAAAKIALAAWERIYQQARSGENATPGAGAFAAQKLTQISQVIATRWPTAPEAASAINILIAVALREDRIPEAQQLLAKLPADARGAAELSLGTALWTKYLQTSAGREGEFDEGAGKLRDQAGALLASGFEAVRKEGEPSTNSAVGVLYYVQLLLARGDGQAARAVLEDKAVGPLTLVETKSAAASRPEFVVEAYKAALRVYLTAQPPDRERSQAMIAALEQFVANQDGASSDQLTKVYIGLGRQLQRQLKSYTAANNTLAAQQLAAAFGDLLAQVAKRLGDDEWAIQNWLAQTNLELGQILKGPDAVAYLTRARAAYAAVLAAAAKGGAGAPNADTMLAVRKRLGDCHIALGEYQNGLEQYVELLKIRPKMLDVQEAAAAAFQTWGREKKIPGPLLQAIHGAVPQPDGKKLIWGWVRIATAADDAQRKASNPADAARYEDMFFEARFNSAQSRYLIATLATPATRRAEFESAKQIVDSMRTLYPALGGPKWKAEFDQLLKQINQELAKP